VARPVPAWQYLAFGVLWVILGSWIVLGSVLNGELLPINVALGVLLLGVGGYWLWRFSRLRRKELEAGPLPEGTK
jgi:hypothetical protein